MFVLLCAACGDSGGRETASAATTTTMTAPVVTDTGVTTTSAAEPTSTGGGTTTTGDGTTGGVLGSSSTGGTTEASTGDSDSFPQTSVVSLDDTGFGETGPTPCSHVLHPVIRDFSTAHPDFESGDGQDPGIVLPDLGPDNKPVYAGQDGNPTTNGQAAFDQWYRDVPDVNITFPFFEISLNDAGNGLFNYDNPAFFPIDEQGFGNEGNSHNYHFTLELHTVFEYSGGEVFKFRGDDDLWVFINKKLAIDLGGVHGPEEKEVKLDEIAGSFGLVAGGVYPLDFFFAERHTSESNFRIETTIACLAPG